MSKPPLMSRKRVETLCRSLRWDSTCCWSTRAASVVDLPGSEPHCKGFSRLVDRAWAARRDVTILSKIFERVLRRTMTLNEAGLS